MNHVDSIAFSHDDKLVFAVFADYLKVWELPTGGAALNTLYLGRRFRKAFAFSHDGKLLAFGLIDNTVRIWEPATGAVLQTLKGHTRVVYCVAFSRDSKLLVSASFDKTVRLWDRVTGASLQTLDVGVIYSKISFSRDGQYLDTDKGLLSLHSSCNPPTSQAQPLRQICVKGDWVTRNGENVLWLPSNYKARSWALHDNLLAIGHASGEITIIEVMP